jgi:type I restriction enzyme M protein
LSRQITDYATGKAVRDNPEEAYRQAFEHILVDDLGYPKSHIGIEVTIQRGANRSAEEADIVVFNDPRHTQDNAYIVVEIETPKKRYDYQALSYVTATTAPLSVWFAGFEKNSAGPYYHYRDLSNDATKFTEIPTLPRFGESFETIGQYRKSDLKPAKALRLLFKRIHHRLYGSGPIKREENVAKEIIKLIFCKILDELSPDDLCQFRATPAEVTTPDGQAVVKKRIQSLFDELLLDPDFGTMFVDEKLEYGPEWITYVVSELQGIGFLHDETNTDALGDAYEVFLPSSLKGESGQFFTPREVVRFAIQMIDPSLEKKEIILDPACGSGGFLSVAIEYLRKQAFELYAPRKFSKDRINQIVKDHAGKYRAPLKTALGTMPSVN